MKDPRIFVPLAAAALFALSSVVTHAYAKDVAGIPCMDPAPLHCVEDGCAPDLLTKLGNSIDPKTGRQFFLDYPCNLRRNEKIVFILNLHGAGSIGNWQRHYFPAIDYKDKYRLVIATPTAATSISIGAGQPGLRMWQAAADDQHLQNIADVVFDRFGRKNIKAFWLAGHSQGGLTANRIVCSDYFKDKVDGWLSLSGGRIGAAPVVPEFFGPSGPPPALSVTGGDGANAPRPGVGVLPRCDISYIFTTGEKEVVSVPEASPIAGKFACGARIRRDDIIDERKGYVTGSAPGRGAYWGREARPGTAQVYVFPKCKGRRVIADVIRLDKGHTEGLEPKVTEALIKMMVSAPGGKVRKGR